jgi:ATP-binding protein involved in chromosome partitioning
MAGELFGAGGGEELASKTGVAFLGTIPAIPELRANSDAGTPHKNFEGNPQLAGALEMIAQNLAGAVSKRNLEGPGPQLNIT